MSPPSTRPSTPPAPVQRAKHIRVLEHGPAMEVQVDAETKLRYLSLRPGRRRAAQLLRQLLDSRGIPIVELAEAMRIATKDVRDMRTGHKPIKAEHIFAMPKRVALAYLDLVRTAVLNDNDHE